MNKHYKFELYRGGKKWLCPECDKKTFVPYCIAGTNEPYDAEVFGRCDREQKCGYIKYPSAASVDMPPRPLVEAPERVDYVPRGTLEATLKKYEMQTLYRYFLTLYPESRVSREWQRYNVGTAKGGASIFWQVDECGKVRTGKIMQYLPDGHRNHANFGTWVHKRIGVADFALKQCFFGIHLLTNDTSEVHIVEAEKTALFMGILEQYTAPHHLWIASGGLQNLQPYKFKPLLMQGCKIYLHPDKGCEAIWRNKIGGLGEVVPLERMPAADQLPVGADIMDYYLMNFYA